MNECTSVEINISTSICNGITDIKIGLAGDNKPLTKVMSGTFVKKDVAKNIKTFCKERKIEHFFPEVRELVFNTFTNTVFQ